MRGNRLLSLSMLAVLQFAVLSSAQAYEVDNRPLAAEFTASEPSQWLNSPPLKVADLAGKVVMVEFWTFDCSNCRRSVPWVKQLESSLADEAFLVVGVHTPEFPHERDAATVAAKVGELGLSNPVMLDNDYAYWMAMGNRYWPAFYLIDQRGHIRSVYIGETTPGSKQAAEIEARIRALLAEGGASGSP